ncbi:efflux ABC transporter, permease protein, partial [mine drainage metagenome]
MLSYLLATQEGTPDIRAAGTLDITGGLVTIHGINHMGLGGLATPSLFRALAVPPLLGHWPSLASGRPGGPHEALLGYGFWKSVFGGSTDALGQRFTFDGKRYRVVGVMPQSFYTIYPAADFWLPRVLTPAMTRDHNINHLMIARLKSGASLTMLNGFLRGYRNRLLAGRSPASRAKAERNGFTISAEELHHSLLNLYLGGKPEPAPVSGPDRPSASAHSGCELRQPGTGPCPPARSDFCRASCIGCIDHS